MASGWQNAIRNPTDGCRWPGMRLFVSDSTDGREIEVIFAEDSIAESQCRFPAMQTVGSA